jgi:lipoyl(octanoyl) transferase
LLLSDYTFHTLTPLNARAEGAGELTVRRLGLQDYQPIWRAMQYIADHPERGRGDEIWLLSHKPVFTLGQAGRAEHVLNPGAIPVVQSDRGGQVTYHGPGQLVVYLLLNMRQRSLGVRELVELIETAIIATLREYGVAGTTRPKAPGVYVENAKIAALGLRIRKGRSYHGLSFNVDMDLEPFRRINPCGFENLSVTQLADHVAEQERHMPLMQRTAGKLANNLLDLLGYQPIDAKSTQPGII